MARHLAIYTGSFDPISYGHLDILRRSRGMFDEVVLAMNATAITFRMRLRGRKKW